MWNDSASKRICYDAHNADSLFFIKQINWVFSVPPVSVEYIYNEWSLNSNTPF